VGLLINSKDSPKSLMKLNVIVIATRVAY